MRSIRLSVSALTLSVAAAVSLTGCGGSSGSSGDGSTNYVDGGTFTMSESSDPGALDPQGGVGSALFQLTQFAYDNLVALDDKGEIQSELAKSWNVDGKTVTFDINDGVTCSDGSAFTAQTAADNITYVENPKNKSPFLGVYVPAGAKASASGSTVTVTLASPSPFVLSQFANLPMVCDSGLKDRASLKSKTAGTGPYVLSEAVPGDHYTYTVRDDYTWGPGGASTSESGTPAKIVVKIVQNETTAANELLAGALNSTQIIGADAQRLEAQNLFHTNTEAMIGEQWYNHADGHATSDQAVRTALTQALDLDSLAKALTSGAGTVPTQLTVLPPTVCTYDATTGNLPSNDTSAAASTLESAGYTKGSDGVYAKGGKPLTITFLVDASLGTGGSAAAELAEKAWKDLGVNVQLKQQDTAALQGVLFGTGNWDVAWEPVNVSTPDQIVPFLSGATLAKGGTNFASIDNSDYTSATGQAMTMNGSEGCDTWKSAEEALYKAADIVPFAANVIPTFGKGATFEVTGNLVPTSIRMLG